MADRSVLMTMEDVALACNIRTGRVKRWHSKGLLVFRLVGRVMVISRGELEDWIDAQTIAHTARTVPDRPPMRRFTLYRFLDCEGALLYVGITATGVSRWAQHAKDKAWWTDVVSVTLEHLESLPELQAAERAAIKTEHPRYNIAGR